MNIQYRQIKLYTDFEYQEEKAPPSETTCGEELSPPNLLVPVAQHKQPRFGKPVQVYFEAVQGDANLPSLTLYE